MTYELRKQRREARKAGPEPPRLEEPPAPNPGRSRALWRVAAFVLAAGAAFVTWTRLHTP